MTLVTGQRGRPPPNCDPDRTEMSVFWNWLDTLTAPALREEPLMAAQTDIYLVEIRRETSTGKSEGR